MNSTFVVTQDHVLTQTNHGRKATRRLPVDSLRQDENDYIDHDPLLVTATFTMILSKFLGGGIQHHYAIWRA